MDEKKRALEISYQLERDLLSVETALEDINEFVGEIIIVCNHLGYYAVDFYGSATTKFPLDNEPQKTKYSGDINAKHFKLDLREALIYALKKFK